MQPDWFIELVGLLLSEKAEIWQSERLELVEMLQPKRSEEAEMWQSERSEPVEIEM